MTPTVTCIWNLKYKDYKLFTFFHTCAYSYTNMRKGFTLLKWVKADSVQEKQTCTTQLVKFDTQMNNSYESILYK